MELVKKGRCLRIFGFAVLLVASLSLSAPNVHAITHTIDFENIYTFPSGAYGQMPPGYGDLTWNQYSWWLTDFWFPHAVVGNVALYNRDRGAITIGFGHQVVFDSAYITPIFRTLDIVVEGWTGGDLLYSQTLTLSNAQPNLLSFDYAGVDTIGIRSTTPGWFTVDTVTYSNPEPSTLLLLGSGLAGLGLWRRRYSTP